MDSLLKAFDQTASSWEDSSVISRINRNEPGAITNADFNRIFGQAKRIWKESDGAFDITVGSLVNAWGFGFKNKSIITDSLIDSLLTLVNFEGISLDGNTVVKTDPRIQIDFNAIAQGYSVDLLGGFLESKGISNYLIDIGGEVLAKGRKPNGTPWIVGIEKPAGDAEAARVVKARLEIENKAIATSGNYRKFFEENGIKYAHTIDPKTGYPAQHTLLSATVIADSASIADAYATALMVMGLDKAKAFLAKKPELGAYLIFSNQDGDYETWATKNLLEMLVE
jgi:thiamine biosynthesis lipoprotein